MEFWHSLELQIPLGTREKILATAMYMQGKVDRGRLQERRAREYHHLLLKMAVTGVAMDDAKAVATLIQLKYNSSPRHMGTAVTAWNYYRKANGIQGELDLYIDHRWSLPTLTPESTLQATISAARRPWWQAFFRLLYETGPRPCEALALCKEDVNFDRQLIRLGTGKQSGETLERELPISPLLCDQLRILTAAKDPDAHVFTKPYAPEKPL